MKIDKELEKLIGPPSEHRQERAYKNLGELHELLLRACPTDSRGKASIPMLAQHLGMSSWGVYKWIKAEKMEPGNAERVVEIGEGRVRIEDFHKFIFR